MKKRIITLMLLLVLLLTLAGCKGKAYKVEYRGHFLFAKDSYHAGETVTLYYPLIATDTDYTFYLDGEVLNTEYSDLLGYRIQFIMPEHDVVLEADARNTMVWNPMQDSSLEELAEEFGYRLTLPQDEFSEISIIRYNLNPIMYEVEFTYPDSFRYCLRIVENSAGSDVSGMYYDWTQVVECDGYTLYLDEEDHGICLWSDGDYGFAISMEDHASQNSLEALYRRINSAMET